MVLLERPSRWPREDARPHRRARGRLPRSDSRHPHGEDPRVFRWRRTPRSIARPIPQEIEQMFAFLSALGVDGHTISPGYEYDAAKKDMIARLGPASGRFFPDARGDPGEIRAGGRVGRASIPILGTPVYLEFLAGLRDLSCSAWAIPDSQYPRLERPVLPDDRRPLRQLSRSCWKRRIGTSLAWWMARRDPRCENCMVHCGYEPTAARHRRAVRRPVEDDQVHLRSAPARVSADGIDAFNAPPKPREARAGGDAALSLGEQRVHHFAGTSVRR